MAAAMLIMACGNDSETEKEQSTGDSGWITIKFVFGPTTQAMTRSTLAELSLTDLWVFDYVGGALKNTIHQASTDAGFGSVALSLEYGDHHLYFVSSRGTSPTVSAPTITWEKPSDTFWSAVPLTIAPSSATIQPVELKRVATRLRITVTDEVPANAAQLKVKPAHWYYGLDVTTGAGTNDQALERSVTIPANFVGTTDKLSASFFGLSPSAEWTTDVDVKLVASDDTSLGSVSLSGVAFRQNRTTAFSGGILGANKNASVTADDAWDDENANNW